MTNLDKLRALAQRWKDAATAEVERVGVAGAVLEGIRSGCASELIALLDVLPLPTGWEVVHGEELEQVRRFRVPGGWLYQTEIDEVHEPLPVRQPNTRVSGWSPPVFVPEPSS